MDFLIVGCHGEDGSGGELMGVGIAQMEKFAKAARSCVDDGKKVAIFTSPKKRAVLSAAIVAREFRVEPRALEALGHNEHYRDGDLLVEEILKAADDSDVVIVICHNSAPAGIINKLSKADARDGIEEERSDNGGGFCYSFAERDFVRLP